MKPKLSSKDGPFHCNICQKDFPKWPSFRRHKLEHLDEKSFRCDQCPSSFNYEANLKLHGMLHEAEKSGSLQCQVCSTKLSRLASLRSHIRIHEKEENLVCAECGDEFPTKGRLEAHLGKDCEIVGCQSKSRKRNSFDSPLLIFTVRCAPDENPTMHASSVPTVR